MKRCSKCQELKEPSEFYADKNRLDGLNSLCKKCSNAANKACREKRMLRINGENPPPSTPKPDVSTVPPFSSSFDFKKLEDADRGMRREISALSMSFAAITERLSGVTSTIAELKKAFQIARANDALKWKNIDDVIFGLKKRLCELEGSE